MSQQPPDPENHPLAGPRPPGFVVELWVSDQLRDRRRRNNAALSHDHQDPAWRRHGRKAEPRAELEAEP
jgi:hypothetical protein